MKTIALLVLILLVVGIIVYVNHASKSRSDNTPDGKESGAMFKGSVADLDRVSENESCPIKNS